MDSGCSFPLHAAPHIPRGRLPHPVCMSVLPGPVEDFYSDFRGLNKGLMNIEENTNLHKHMVNFDYLLLRFVAEMSYI